MRQPPLDATPRRDAVCRLLGLMLLLPALASAALADPLADGMRRCRLETDAQRRLACFDALAASLPRIEADQFGMTSDIARKRAAAAPATGAAARTAAPSTAAAPASGAEPEHAAAARPTPAPAAAPDGLSANIAALREGPRGELLFTLDNQQVWRQVEPQPSIRFSVGEAVRIEPGAMSSLWLSAKHGRKTKVKRVS